jgi:hypothetical protein
MERRVTLVFLIDALGWQIAERFAFASARLPQRRELGTVLGYSSAAIPSLLSGATPVEHGSWSMFRRAGAGGTFRFLRALPPLPHALEWRLRPWVRRWVDRREHVGAYYDLYEIPLHLLSHFELGQTGNSFEPGGLAAETVFDWMRARGVRYRLWDYRSDEEANFAQAERALSDPPDVLFVYTAELDALMHRVGIFHDDVCARLARYESFLASMADAAARAGVALDTVILSDHGMTDVTRTVDVIGALDDAGLKAGKDYVAFFDSTMAQPHDLAWRRLADSGGVGQHDVVLQLGEIGGLDAHAREFSEPGVDAVDGLAPRNDGIDGARAGLDRGPGRRIEANRSAAINVVPVVELHVSGLQDDRAHWPLHTRR